MKAEIITIGDEILIGQIIDTNSGWIAQQLQKFEVDIVQMTSIPDTEEAIFNTLKSASSRADLILITGGLGPTKGDVTKNTAAKYFGTTLNQMVEVNQVDLLLMQSIHHLEILQHSKKNSLLLLH